MVSEVDLLRKEEYQEEPAAVRPPRWRRGDGRSMAKGCAARDVMTSPAVTVAPDATVVEAARLLDRHRVRRLVVIDADGRLAGIVIPRPPTAPAHRARPGSRSSPGRATRNRPGWCALADWAHQLRSTAADSWARTRERA